MKFLITILGLVLCINVHANDSAFKNTRQTVVAMGHGCDIRLQVPVNAYLTSRHENKGFGNGTAGLKLENPFNLQSDNVYAQTFYMGFTCYAEDDDIVGASAVRFDSERNEWVRDIEKRIAATHATWSTKDLMEMRRDFARAIQVYPLKTTNASGYAYSEDDTTGVAQWHRRTLNFCLIKPPKALCGGNFNGYYVDNKETDLTPYFLQILRSIEFIDDVPPAHSSNDSDDIE